LKLLCSERAAPNPPMVLHRRVIFSPVSHYSVQICCFRAVLLHELSDISGMLFRRFCVNPTELKDCRLFDDRQSCLLWNFCDLRVTEFAAGRSPPRCSCVSCRRPRRTKRAGADLQL